MCSKCDSYGEIIKMHIGGLGSIDMNDCSRKDPSGRLKLDSVDLQCSNEVCDSKSYAATDVF